MVIFTMENWPRSLNTANRFVFQGRVGFSLLTSIKCSFSVVRVLKTVGRIGYIHQTWQRITKSSLVWKNTTNYRVCPTLSKRRAIKMAIVVISVALWKYCSWIAQLFSTYFKKEFIKINLMPGFVSLDSKTYSRYMLYWAVEWGIVSFVILEFSKFQWKETIEQRKAYVW